MSLPEYTPDTSSLPLYEPSVSLQSELACKLEWVSPTRRNFGRRWYKANVTLNSTQLTISPVNSHIESPRVLTMQYAEIGFAADYRKGSFPLRLRAEGIQYLIDFHTLFSAVQWLHAIELSIGISLPLELREEPKANYKKAHRIRRSTKFREEVQREKDMSDSESIGSFSLSVCSNTSETERCKAKNNSLMVLEDIPKNMTFYLRDFGVILNRQNWTPPFEMTY